MVSRRGRVERSSLIVRDKAVHRMGASDGSLIRCSSWYRWKLSTKYRFKK
jgi:hypothetical protein